MMEELAAKTAEAAEREAELQLLADCDPDVVKKQGLSAVSESFSSFLLPLS